MSTKYLVLISLGSFLLGACVASEVLDDASDENKQILTDVAHDKVIDTATNPTAANGIENLVSYGTLAALVILQTLAARRNSKSDKRKTDAESKIAGLDKQLKQILEQITSS